MQDNSKKVKVKTEKISKSEIQRRQMYLKRQEDFYENILSKEKEKRLRLSELLTETTTENERLQKENDRYNLILTRNKKAQAEAQAQQEQLYREAVNKLSKKIINCRTPSLAVINIGFSKKKDRGNITGRYLKITHIDELSCKTGRHTLNHNLSKIVIETEREKDEFCLALCNDCLNALIAALKQVDDNNPYYYDDYSDIEVKYISRFNGQQCFSCYKDNLPSYNVRIGNIAFKICSDCRACWLMQLERAARK